MSVGVSGCVCDISLRYIRGRDIALAKETSRELMREE